MALAEKDSFAETFAPDGMVELLGVSIWAGTARRQGDSGRGEESPLKETMRIDHPVMSRTRSTLFHTGFGLPGLAYGTTPAEMQRIP